MMYEADFLDLEEEESMPKKKKRSVWVKPFLVRRQDPTCDTMFMIQREFLAVSAIAQVYETKIEQSLTIFLIYYKCHPMPNKACIDLFHRA